MLLMAAWTFLTNHAWAPLFAAHDPKVRRHDIAASQGTTERGAYGTPSPTRLKPATSWPFLPAPTRGRNGGLPVPMDDLGRFL
jgi:hypothetical protein